MKTTKHTPRQAAANSRLFTAAPDLLEACQQIVWKLGHNGEDGPVKIDRLDATVRMAIAAVAKATT